MDTNITIEKENYKKIGSSQFLSSEELSVVDLIQILWSHKLILLFIIFSFTAIGILYAIKAKDVFTTSTVFITKSGNTSNSNFANLASLAGISIDVYSNNGDPADYLDQVIQDKEFLLPIIEKKWVYKGDSLYLYQIWNPKPDSTLNSSKYVNDKLNLDNIRRNNFLNLYKDPKKGILTLTINSPDPKLSFDLNIFVISKLSDFIRNSLKSQAKEKRVFIEERITEVKEDLRNSENALARFKERNVINSSPKIMLEEMRLTRAVTLNQEIYIQFQKQYEISRIEELNDQPLIQIIKNPEMPIKKSKPNRSQIVVLFCIMGVFIGVFGILSFNFMFRLIQSTSNSKQ